MSALSEVRLARNFKAKEFRCRGEESDAPCACHGAIKISQDLVDALQVFREELWGGPLIVLSGFRCDLYNEHVGGHPLSYHRIGLAADIRATEVVADDYPIESVAADMSAILEDLYGTRGGVIYYPRRSFFHVDMADYSARMNDRLREM